MGGGIPVRSTRIPAKAGPFLSYKHSIPLCRDDIMLRLQIVPGEIVRDGVFAGNENVSTFSKPSRPGKHPVPPTI